MLGQTLFSQIFQLNAGEILVKHQSFTSHVYSERWLLAEKKLMIPQWRIGPYFAKQVIIAKKMYLYRDPMRDGGKIRTPSINSNPEYQLISRVAPSQLKKPRVRSVDTRGWSWYEGFVLPPSRIRGPGIDITTFPQSKFLLIFAFIFFLSIVTMTSRK